MATSGGLGCPDSDARQDYYGMGGIPHLVFDGIIDQVGASAEHANGEFYRSIIEDELLIDSPLSVSVMSYSFVGSDPYITIEIEVFEELTTTANTYLRVGLCENHLLYGGDEYHNVLRDMLDDVALTAQYVGEVQEVTIPLSIGAWDPSEMWAFAIVQRDSDQYIYNAGSTYITPYSVTIETDGPTTALVDGPHTFDTTSITHIGTVDTHTLDLVLDLSELPTGWDAYFTYGGDDLTTTTVTLAQYEAAELAVTLVPGDEGDEGRALLNVHSHSGEMADIEVAFTGIRGGADLLVVADDAGADYARDYFGPAIEAAGYSFVAWDRTSAAIDLVTLEQFDAVIWYAGDTSMGLDADDRAAVQAYLEAGNAMLLTGQDLAQATANAGGGSWLISVLRTYYRQNYADGGALIDGVADNPISDGLSLNLVGGDGADNYSNTDVVSSIGGTNIFTYTDVAAGQPAGAAAEYNGYKVIFLGFGFESINAEADRLTLMDRCLDWLIGTTSGVNDGLPQVVTLKQNLPNPFNPQTTISFDLPKQMAVTLSVYDVSGRLVDVLLSSELGQQGHNQVIWQGNDANGRSLPSGTYFYRLDAGDIVETKSMMLLK